MKKNVLVFPCGSEIGLEILRSLEFSTHFEVYGGSSVDNHGKLVYKNYIGGIAYVGKPQFVDQINEIISKFKIDFIIPAHDSVLLELANAEAAGKLNCTLITSPLSTCEIARSKRKTYQALAGVLPTPKIYDSADDLRVSDFPVFLKPDVGQGSKGTQKAGNKKQAEFYLEMDNSLLILEYLPGKEYTVDCFTSSDGKLVFSEGRERVRTLNGISVNSAVSDDKIFFEMAAKINQELSFRGAWFFQVKERAGGQLVLLEIAPRIAGTMALARSKGVNLPLLSLFDAMGYKLDILENKYQLTIDRALENRYQHDISYQHVYLDLDDLVIFDGEINPAVMAFVFQCINKNIKLHLLTRHKEDLEASLLKHKLSGIFDELIWLKHGEEKPAHIKQKGAIFIDDSFAERKKVYDECNIPVFDAHMLESLMEKF